MIFLKAIKQGGGTTFICLSNFLRNSCHLLNNIYFLRTLGVSVFLQWTEKSVKMDFISYNKTIERIFEMAFNTCKGRNNQWFKMFTVKIGK